MPQPRMAESVERHHLSVLLKLSIASRILVLLLVYLSSYLPLFDASPTLVRSPTWPLPLLRWDAFHFTHLAHTNLQYTYEYEWAFFPGTPLVMRTVAWLYGGSELHHLMLAGAMAAAACDSTTTLYGLTLHHLRSPSLAFLASLLSLLPTSPATLRLACYSEPFFTLFSYKGMLACTREKWFNAACYFMLAGVFRSNGVLLAGFITWGLIVQPYFDSRNFPSLKSILYTVLLTTIIVLPFFFHHYTAYVAFCRPLASSSSTPSTAGPVPEWCKKFPPSIYTHVQSTYWNVGLFKYWTVSQLPNFIIAAPVIALLLSFSSTHLIGVLRARADPKVEAIMWHSPSITPHAIHALILTCTLLFASHTQIILRLASSMPIVYWAAAKAVVDDQTSKAPWVRWGYMWVCWSVVWGAVSVVLWTAFLPPA